MIYFLLFLASFIWGFNIIVMKLLLIDISFIMLACLRVFISLLFIAIYMFIKRISFYYKDYFKVFVISFFSVYLNFYFTFLAMSYLEGAQIVFTNALSLLITCLLSCLFFKNKISKREGLSIILTLSAFLISIQFDFNILNSGFFFMILGLIFYALSHVLVVKFNIVFSITFIFYQLLFGFIMLFIHCLLFNEINFNSLYSLSLNQWILFIVFSGLGFAYIQVIYFWSIEKIGVFLTSTFLSFNPVVTYIGSILFLSEDMLLRYNIGVILIVCSLFVNLWHKIEIERGFHRIEK